MTIDLAGKTVGKRSLDDFRRVIDVRQIGAANWAKRSGMECVSVAAGGSWSHNIGISCSEGRKHLF